MAEMTPEEVEQSLNNDVRYQALSGPDRVAKRKEVYEALGMRPPEYLAKPGTRELDPEGPVHTYVRPALEAAGMIGGGIIGSAAGPAGTVAGSVLGYGLGDTGAAFLERLAGERPPISSPAEAVMEPVRSLQRGAIIEALGQGTGRLVGFAKTKIGAPFADQYSGLNRTLDEVAQSKGIKLDPHEVIQSRPLALGHKVLENVPFTAGMIQRNELHKLEGLTREWERLQTQSGTKNRARMGDIGLKIQDTIEKELQRLKDKQVQIIGDARDQILRASGSPLSYRELGEQTQQAIKQHHEGLRAIEDAAWEYAREGIPEGRVITANLRKAAEGIKKEYENIPSFLDEPLMKQLSDVSGSGNKKYDALMAQVPDGLGGAAREKIIRELVGNEQPGWSIESLLKLRSALSDSIYQHHTGLQRGDTKKGAADAYGRIYTRLIKALDEDLATFGNAQASDVAERFTLARAASGQRLSFFNAKDHPAVVKAINADPTKLAQSLITPGSASGYVSLKEAIGAQGVAPVKQAFTNTLLNVGGKEADGVAGLRASLDRYGRQTLEEVYSPSEVKNLYALADRANWSKHSPVGNPFFRELMKTAPTRVAPTILEHPQLTEKVLRQFPRMLQPLREAFVDALKPNPNTPFPTTMMKQLNAYPAEVQRRLFSQEELKDFTLLARIVERTQGTVRLAENPSGTAQNLVTFSTAGAVLKHPIAMAPTVISTAGLGKLYLSKVGRKYLLEGLVTPASSSRATELATKMLGIAGMDIAQDQAERRRMRLGIPLDPVRLERAP